eukprot:SAG25_NODE_154_length_13563_cov_44.588978_21_plen_98_part_00
MPPNYRGVLAIIPPAVLRALTSQSAVLRFSRAAILAGLLPVCMMGPRSWRSRATINSPSRARSLLLTGARRCLHAPLGHRCGRTGLQARPKGATCTS